MSDQIRASHILLMYQGSMRSTATRSREEAETQIAELKARIDNGAEFADVAREFSDCPSSAEGGSLGSFGRGMMVKGFEDAAFALQPGEVSGVVETPFGFHLIQRTA
ncbi:peptidylprolyl isomerase [Telmatospirillum sp. J64-1]|uniref:peptidylprolyl isomerase n=1 Tax=Telmatospirillum sp. J64-1 TaxID=2502183 RepID=UPI00115D5FFD|nr:peptidylprolyl isomerase [Telmatospirillum sp. J64-1]